MWTQRLTVLVPALAGLLLALAAPVLSAERVALVVGNSAYSETTALRNPVNDATAMAAALRRLGFEVIEGRNLDREGFFDKIDAFDEAVRTAKMALFFYAGHGLQVGGRNYLAPVDMRLEKKQDLRRRAVELAAVLEVMDSETNLVILDACRNNPLAGDLERSLRLDRNMLASRGLARVKSTGEMLIAYATAPGNVAADGDGDHSPYTEALLAHIEKPGLSVQELFTEVTGSVKNRTGGKQTPWTNSSLSKVVGLVPSVSPGAAVAEKPASDRLSAEHLAAERVFWESVKDSTNAADLQAYLDQYPGGTYATLARIRLRAVPPQNGQMDYARARRLFEQAAETGHPLAVMWLAWGYVAGRVGFAKDVERAQELARGVIEEIQRLARAGDREASFLLGSAYYEGLAVTQDHGQAVSWYRRAAEQGHGIAQNDLGWMYERGHGIEQSDREAIEWYRKAAEQGDADAQHNLGRMYKQGRGGEQSDSEAVKWFHKATEQGHERAQFNLGVMYLRGRGVAQSDREAIKWYRKAAEQGDEMAQFNLGWMYKQGHGVEQSDSEAVKWYRKAAEQGHERAQSRLAEMGH